MNRKDKKEIRIFKMFATVCPYSIHLDSIRKKEPPEPDISCNLIEGDTMTFELLLFRYSMDTSLPTEIPYPLFGETSVVECIDKNIAQSLYDSLRIKKALDDGLKKFPQKEQFETSFRNASIHIVFEKIPSNKRILSIPIIFNYLLTLKNNATGKLDCRFNSTLKNIVNYILVARVEFKGPKFDVEAVAFFADPCTELIQHKFQKEYKSKPKPELLAYYELQPEIPENCWLPDVQDFIEKNIQSSIFKRVWIYSVTANRIIFAYPDFDATAPNR